MQQFPSKLEDLSEFVTVHYDEEIVKNFVFKTDLVTLKERMKNLTIVGHRCGFQPDNTLESLDLAVKNNVKAVEIDVYLSKDEQVFVIHAGHKGEMEQFTGIKDKFINEYNSQEIEVLKTKQGFFIPKLQPVLEICKQNNILLLIELKGFEDKLPIKVIELIQKTDMLGLSQIITFNDKFLEQCKQILNEKQICPLKDIVLTRVYKNLPENTNDAQFYSKIYNCDSISICASEMQQQILYDARKLNENLKINCWWCRTISDNINKKESLEQYLLALDCPLNAITTDFPLVVEQIRQYILKL